MLENTQFIICLEKYFKFQIILKKTFLKINVNKKNIGNDKLDILKIKNFFVNKTKNIFKSINYYIDSVEKIQYQKILIFNNKYNFYIKSCFFKNKKKIDFNKNNIVYCFYKKIFIINLEKNIFNLFSFNINSIKCFIKINFLNQFFFKKRSISFFNDNFFILSKRKMNFFCLKENVDCVLKLKNKILILLLNIKKKKKKIFLFLKNEKKIIFSLNKNYIFLKNIEKHNQTIKLKIYIKKGQDFFFCFNSKHILNFIKNKVKFLLINYFINNQIVVLKKYFTLLKKCENCFKTIGYM